MIAFNKIALTFVPGASNDAVLCNVPEGHYGLFLSARGRLVTDATVGSRFAMMGTARTQAEFGAVEGYFSRLIPGGLAASSTLFWQFGSNECTLGSANNHVVQSIPRTLYDRSFYFGYWFTAGFWGAADAISSGEVTWLTGTAQELVGII